MAAKQLQILVTQSAADTTTYTAYKNPMFGRGGIRPKLLKGQLTPSLVTAVAVGDFIRWTLFKSDVSAPLAVPGSGDIHAIAGMDIVGTATAVLGQQAVRISDFNPDDLIVSEFIVIGISSLTTGQANAVGLTLDYEEVDYSDLKSVQELYR